MSNGSISSRVFPYGRDTDCNRTMGTINDGQYSKKIIGANLIGDGVNLVLIGIGYRPGGFIPEVMHHFHATATPSSYSHLLEFGEFASNASYSLPFALVLTNIVIGASTLSVMLALAIILYNKYHTLSVQKMFEGED